MKNKMTLSELFRNAIVEKLNLNGELRKALIELGWTPPKEEQKEEIKNCTTCGCGNKAHDLPTIECSGCGPMTNYHKWIERPEMKNE